MYKPNITRRRDSFNANCISRNGSRRENAFNIVEKRQDMHDKAYFRNMARRCSDTSVIEFDEEAWIDKNRKIAFAGCKSNTLQYANEFIVFH